MILLEVEGVRKHFGPEPVLDGVTFDVRPGERIGLVGPNGSGKTTLLRILAGKDDADAGACRVHATTHLGYLEQQPHFDAGRTLHDEAKDALADLILLEREALEVAEALSQDTDPVEHKRLAARYDHLQHELHRQDAYNLDHRIERVLEGLRFRRDTFAQPVASLSGGEQNRLMLAKLLLAEPNLMLLDEPSNHLDIEATEWLEDFLLESSAAMLVVSHDRYFLDKVTNRTLELFRGTVDSYVGNFSAYWRQKDERLLVQRRTYERQQLEIEKAKEFIRRNAYSQKHAQAEDRRKKLERIEPVPPPREIAAPPMGFAPAARSGDIVVRAERVAKAYERPLFSNLTVDIIRGQRWALLGPNGCGKTTLLRCLLGIISPDAGQIVLGQGVSVGYFDQQLAELDAEAVAAEVIRPKHKQLNTQQRRDLLARFGVTGDTGLQKVGSLSGGETCRVALARLAAADANFLVLDEPTNHLDLWARDALERALTRFDGSVLFVSHDRYFVNQVADHLLIVEPDRVRVVEGNYETYHLLQSGKAESPAEETTPASKTTRPEKLKAKASKQDQPTKHGNKGKPAKHDKSASQHKPVKAKQDKTDRRDQVAQPPKADKPDKPSKNPAKQRRFPYRKLADLEDEIFIRETCLQQLQGELVDPAILRNGNRVRDIKNRIADEESTIKTLYEHWEEASELNW